MDKTVHILESVLKISYPFNCLIFNKSIFLFAQIRDFVCKIKEL